MTVLPLTLVELRRQIAIGDIAPDEALDAQYRTINAQADQWHCCTHLFPAPDGTDAQPSLAGIGLAHKDIFAMRARAPGCGAKTAPKFSATSGPVMRRLKRAGSTPMAALSLAEFAGGITGENPYLTLPVNPIDANAAVGGSSSGSAVAVASGLCYGSLGTDTAGSIRIPAASCGVVGLLPTRGLLPMAGCYPLAPNLDTIGVMARSAMDAAQIFAACLTRTQKKQLLPDLIQTCGHLQQQDWQRLTQSLKNPQSLRLGMTFAHSSSRHTPAGEHAQVLHEFAESRVRLGHTVDQTTLTEQRELIRCASTLLHVEAAATHYQALQQDDCPLSAITRAVALPGTALPVVWYEQCLRQRQQARNHFVQKHLTDHDIVLTPVLPQGLPDWNEVHTQSATFNTHMLLSLFSWSAFVNYLGLPAVVFPIGTDQRNRPISIQAIGRPGSEAALLAFAYEYEQEHFGTNGFVTSPPAMCTAA